jgi:hypothetical protein
MSLNNEDSSLSPTASASLDNDAVAASIDNDARTFGLHFKQGGWRLGLLVARNVYVSDDERGRRDLKAPELGKVTANQFAEKAGVTAKTVQLYYRAWELAAKAKKCRPA